MKEFLARKDIVISVKRYGIDALGAMAQGLFCTLLIGTIINTLGTQLNIEVLTRTVVTINEIPYTIGGLASAMCGPAMAVAIGYALNCPPLVLFSLISVGFASNALGGAGGPLAVLFVAIIASEVGKAVSKETKIDILVTPMVTIGVGVALSAWWAPALGAAAMKVGSLIMWASAVPDGNFSFRYCRRCTYTSDFVRGYLCSITAHGACRWSCGRRMLCADGGIRGYVF